MNHSLQKENTKNSVFENMVSILNPSKEEWPVSLVLPPPISYLDWSKEAGVKGDGKLLIKQKRVNTDCPHKDRKHYAKNMCNNCYHKNGRDRTAWACEHSDRKLYAKGKCQFCYLKNYIKSRQETTNMA
jgi:hypothetical protein